jgi:broad specificity phosphatase PhoE
MRRLVLVRHAPTPATRAAAFPADEALDDRGRSAATALSGVVRGDWETMSSPALRCRQTAAAAGLAEPRLDDDLGECDFGDWAGRTLAEVHAEQPEASVAWMTDPGAAPHGGESLSRFVERVGRFLDREAARDGKAVAVTHGGVAKAAVVHALGAPIAAFWRLDAAPLSITELHAHEGRWTVTRVNDTRACGGRGA